MNKIKNAIDFDAGQMVPVTGPERETNANINPITTERCNSHHNGINADRIIVH